MLEFAEWLQATPLSVAIQSTLWVTPLLQTIHIVMIGIVFVSMLNVALRVLGQIRTDEPLRRGLAAVLAVVLERARVDGGHGARACDQ